MAGRSNHDYFLTSLRLSSTDFSGEGDVRVLQTLFATHSFLFYKTVE